MMMAQKSNCVTAVIATLSMLGMAGVAESYATTEHISKPFTFMEGDNPNLVRNFEPYDTKYQSGEAKASVTELHVVFSNHLDIGFNVRAWCDGDDGCTSPGPTKTGLPCRPWAYWVLNENINVFLPRAVQTALDMEKVPSNTGGRCPSNPSQNKQTDCGFPKSTQADCEQKKCCWMQGGAEPSGHWCIQPQNSSSPTPPPPPPDKYIYMTQPWVASFMLDCEKTGFRDWRNPEEGLGAEIIECPNATTIRNFKQAVANGSIFWQAFPHNAAPGAYDSSLFDASLDMGHWMATELGVAQPTTFSQRDETGMTRAILPLLNKRGVTMISLGSGGSSGGHPVIPDLFLWRDEASKAEVVFTFDHGYGGGTHILPNGHALYCAWNTDNGGPQTASSVAGTLSSLRKQYPNANVHASTFDDFAKIATSVKDQLPLVTSEIGDTWLYGIPSDPLKNVWFRAFSRVRRACVNSGACDPTDMTMRRFDRLLTKIPEHTWGEDTTWYLHDYDNWTNTQVGTAMHQDNYNMTVESWREQRSYLVNALGVLKSDENYTKLAQAMTDEVNTYASLTEEPTPSSMGYHQVSDIHSTLRCDAASASLSFGAEGGIASLKPDSGMAWTGPLAKFTYQTLSSDDFTAFDADYGNGGCKATTENPGCHNFHKPNMSSAHPQHLEVSPNLTQVWVSSDGCSFAAMSEFPPMPGNVSYGPPTRVWTRVELSSLKQGVSADVTVNWVNKSTTRLAEATWVSFDPTVSNSKNGWSIWSLDTSVDPTDVVEHGAVHLHTMGPDGGMIYKGPEGTAAIYSIDAPVVSCGLLSPFPTPGDNSTLKENMAKGMHWNTNNNIWNTNYPQWYPFEGTEFSIYGKKDASLGQNAAFRFRVDLSSPTN
eukprot:m.202065 g.202065  ORF g.202065 m.202065 type:complete len:879 (+) comp32815_c1_seq1:127-2763(+)